MSQAIGIIEALGLAAAIEAADTAVKSANVRLIGYELSRGGGWVTVKFTGDVGAVNAAITAGVVAAGKVTEVVSKLIIARPHEGLKPMIYSKDNVPGMPQGAITQPEFTEPATPDDSIATNEFGQACAQDGVLTGSDAEIEHQDAAPTDIVVTLLVDEQTLRSDIEPALEAAPDAERVAAVEEDMQQTYTCNSCKDPACPRKKGEPRNTCIHEN